MSLEERLDADLHAAIRSGDNVRKLAIRAVKAAISEAMVAGAEARKLTEDEQLGIVIRQIKQRRDSIEDFRRGNRPDLAASEEAELAVLQEYLPPQMDEAEVRRRAELVIAEMGARDLKGMGPVMKRLSADLRGRADGQMISRIVRELLTGVS